MLFPLTNSKVIYQQFLSYDLEMINELGFCTGIENYSRHFDGRNEGEPPFTLMDYFPKDYLLIIDESHQTIPQAHAMYNGDYSRKKNLVDFGFRLPSALDNRPLMFEEFEQKMQRTLFVSATPAEYEMQKSGSVVELITRPTGLLDPEIELHPIEHQMQHLMQEAKKTITQGNRVLITTLTKRMAEDLADYLTLVVWQSFASDTLGCIIKSAFKFLHRRFVKECCILLSILQIYIEKSVL